jgi:hypothetical protein
MMWASIQSTISSISIILLLLKRTGTVYMARRRRKKHSTAGLRESTMSGNRGSWFPRMGFLKQGITTGVSVNKGLSRLDSRLGFTRRELASRPSLTTTGNQSEHNHLSPQDSWTRANELLAQGGSLSDVTALLENYLRRGRSTIEAQAEMPVSEVEAWSLLGRVHAMNEKEDKALAAFEAGRKALEAGQGGTNVAGEMLTVSHSSLITEKY